jgi:hypothetical protein
VFVDEDERRNVGSFEQEASFLERWQTSDIAMDDGGEEKE